MKHTIMGPEMVIASAEYSMKSNRKKTSSASGQTAATASRSALRKEIARGEKAIERGKVLSQSEAKQKMARWLKQV